MQLINFVLECAGCPLTLSTAQFEDENTESIFKAAESEEYKRLLEESEYPLVSKEKRFRNMKKAYRGFWVSLIEAARPKKILFDEFFLDTFSFWLTVISSCAARPLRLAGTLAGLRITTALTNVARQQSSELTTTEQQLEAERRRDANSERATTLAKKAQRVGKHVNELHSILGSLFKRIFSSRYRDVEIDIRQECLSALGAWIRSYPQLWFADAYLKYLGWECSDMDPTVRHIAFTELATLYKPDNYEKLAEFSRRFKERIIGATLDVDPRAGEAAITLAVCLLKADMLEQADIVNVCSLTSERDVRLRFAAAEFVFHSVYVTHVGSDPTQRDEASDAQKQKEIRSTLDFLTETSLVSSTPAFLIDAMWGKLQAFTDWKAMCDVFLDEELRVSEAQQVLLAEMIVCCARKALGLPICSKAKSDPDVKVSKADKTRHLESYCKHVMQRIPELLAHAQDDTRTLALLFELPRYFNLELYKHYRLQKHFDALLESIHDAFLKANESELLYSIAVTYQSLVFEDHSLKPVANAALLKLVGQAQQQIAKARKAKRVAPLEAALARFSMLSTVSDTSAYEFVRDVPTLLELSEREQDDDSSVSSELVSQRCMEIMFSDLQWSVYSLGERPERVALANAVAKRDALLAQLEQCLEAQREGVRNHAFHVLLQLLVVCSRFFDGTPKAALAYTIDESLQEKLVRHYEQHITALPDDVEKRAGENDEQAEQELEQVEQATIALARPYANQLLYKKAAVPMFANYHELPKRVREIAKRVLEETRKTSARDEWQLMHMVLQSKFEEAAGDYTVLRKLAQKLAATYGIQVSKPALRASVLDQVSEGVAFALAAGHGADRLAFLTEALMPFLAKLSPNDVRHAQRIFDRIAADAEYKPSADEPSDAYYFQFANYLENAKSGARTPTKRAPPRMPRKLNLAKPKESKSSADSAKSNEKSKEKKERRKTNSREKRSRSASPKRRKSSQSKLDYE